MIPESTRPLRDRLAARGRLRTLTAPAPEEVAVPPRAHFRASDPEPDPGACPHPLAEARFDGLWRLDGLVMAAVTCTRCSTSLAIECREDVVARIGGERAHGGGPDSLVRMPERKDG